MECPNCLHAVTVKSGKIVCDNNECEYSISITGHNKLSRMSDSLIEIVKLAESHGWNGVENSKFLEVFLAGEIEDRKFLKNLIDEQKENLHKALQEIKEYKHVLKHTQEYGEDLEQENLKLRRYYDFHKDVIEDFIDNFEKVKIKIEKGRI